MGDTAERLMDVAEARMRDSGYNGYSFRDLANEIGIKSSSVHHHFPTKAALTAAVMRRYADRVLAAADELAADGMDAIAIYHSIFRSVLRPDGRMCLAGALGAEAGALPPNVAAGAQDAMQRVTEDLARRLGGPDAKPRADLVIATLEGAMMLARVLNDFDAFDTAAAALF